ncbi:MAG: Bax inhibitor-1/YccA family protein [Vampirovibrionia bacterium]
MRTANPALNDKAFEGFGPIIGRDNTMTVQGTVNKTALLSVCLVAAAFWVWTLFFSGGHNEAIAFPWMLGGVLGGLVVAIIIIFKKTWAPMLSPVYALLEGFFIGGMSAVMESMYPGIVIQAVGLTFGVLFCMRFLYKTGIINVTK